MATHSIFQSTVLHRAGGVRTLSPLPLALMIATLVSPAHAEIYFNPRFLNDDAAENVDLSAFANGQEAPPGTYRVDIELNGEYMTSRDITFVTGASGEVLIPCLSHSLLESLGVKKEAFATVDANVADNCVPLADQLPNSSTEFDVGQLRLSLSIPQIYVSTMARGYIAPDLWEDGINAGLINYSFSGNSINSKSNRNSGNRLLLSYLTLDNNKIGKYVVSRRIMLD